MLVPFRRFIGLLAVGVVAASCGGGGGGGGKAPVAAISASIYTGESPLDVEFDASASTDPDGSVVGYSWNFGDGTTADQAIVSHRFDAPGPYRVTLTVTDNSGKRSSTIAVVTAINPGPDPLLASQWHLSSAAAGVDAVPAWLLNCDAVACRGDGVRIAIVDDGLEILHPDLSANIVNGASYNYLDGSSDPTPRQVRDEHGTAVAGLAAARGDNSEGGSGVAPRAGLVGYNVLQNATETNQADAMVRGRENIGVSTNSWGAPDATGQLQPSGLSWRTAIETGLREGRGGLGTVYTWAAGNGHQVRVQNQAGEVQTVAPVDNSNYDGQANFYGVMAIGAVGPDGTKASYSEEGANIWVVAPGGEASCSAGQLLTTTDLTGDAGLNAGGPSSTDLPDPDYTRCMNGTSAATPLAAGVAALVLQANPNLSWRDVRMVLAASAKQNHPDDPDWQTNAAGHLINHKYGFGLVDADAAIATAQSWQLLPAMATVAAPSSATKPVNLTIVDNDVDGASALQDTIAVSGSNIANVEWVDVEFTSNHNYAGDLEIILTSPAGTVSRLSETHLCQGHQCTPSLASDGVWTWHFGSGRHLDEPADGNWTLRVVDRATGDTYPGTGNWISWRLTIRGH